MVVLPPGASAAAEDPVGAAPRMPLGPADLQTVAGTVQTLAPRVTYQKFSQGKPSDVWSVELEIPTNEQGGRSWMVGNPKYADALVNQLADEGFAGRVDTRQVRVLTGGEAVLSESMVRVGAFRYDKQAGCGGCWRPPVTRGIAWSRQPRTAPRMPRMDPPRSRVKPRPGRGRCGSSRWIRPRLSRSRWCTARMSVRLRRCATWPRRPVPSWRSTGPSCGGVGDNRRDDGLGAYPETKPWRGALCRDPQRNRDLP